MTELRETPDQADTEDVGIDPSRYIYGGAHGTNTAPAKLDFDPYRGRITYKVLEVLLTDGRVVYGCSDCEYADSGVRAVIAHRRIHSRNARTQKAGGGYTPAERAEIIARQLEVLLKLASPNADHAEELRVKRAEIARLKSVTAGLQEENDSLQTQVSVLREKLDAAESNGLTPEKQKALDALQVLFSAKG